MTPEEQVHKIVAALRCSIESWGVESPKGMPGSRVERTSKLHVTPTPKVAPARTYSEQGSDRGTTIECLWVVNYDKVAYWAEKMLRTKCAQCDGTGKVSGTKCVSIKDRTNRVIMPGCNGRKTTQMHTAWTHGKLRYANYLIQKARLEVEEGVDLIEWDSGDGIEMLALPKPKEKLVFTFDRTDERCVVVGDRGYPKLSVENMPVREGELGSTPLSPGMREGDLIVSEWDVAKTLILAMQKVRYRVKIEGAKWYLQPFGSEKLGIQMLFDVMWDHNEVEPDGVYLRGDPQQLHKVLATLDKESFEYAMWRNQKMLAIITNYEHYAEDLEASLTFAQAVETGSTNLEVPVDLPESMAHYIGEVEEQ